MTEGRVAAAKPSGAYLGQELVFCCLDHDFTLRHYDTTADAYAKIKAKVMRVQRSCTDYLCSRGSLGFKNFHFIRKNRHVHAIIPNYEYEASA